MKTTDFRRRFIYDIETDFIGKGGFAKVYKALDTTLNQTVALKFYTGSVGERYDLMAELRHALPLKHPNLVRYFDVVTLESDDQFTGNNNIQVGVMEYANAGDWNAFVKTFPDLDTIAQVVYGLLSGLTYLHNRGIAHRDIKPHNILLHKTHDGQLHCKITDFGLAKNLTENSDSSTLLGTVEFMAPEQFDPKRYGIENSLATNVDLWATGILLYELFTGDLPFGSRQDGYTQEQVMYNILRSEPNTDILNEIPEPYLSMIKWCLVKEAPKRVNNAQLLLDMMPIPAQSTENSNSEIKTAAPLNPTNNETKTNTPQSEITTRNEDTIETTSTPPALVLNQPTQTPQLRSNSEKITLPERKWPSANNNNNNNNSAKANLTPTDVITPQTKWIYFAVCLLLSPVAGLVAWAYHKINNRKALASEIATVSWWAMVVWLLVALAYVVRLLIIDYQTIQPAKTSALMFLSHFC